MSDIVLSPRESQMNHRKLDAEGLLSGETTIH